MCLNWGENFQAPSLQKRCPGMHLKESSQGFFSDVYFGLKDLAAWQSCFSHSTHPALQGHWSMGWTEISSPLWLLPEPGHPWPSCNWRNHKEPPQSHHIFHWSYSNTWQWQLAAKPRVLWRDVNNLNRAQSFKPELTISPAKSTSEGQHKEQPHPKSFQDWGARHPRG